ncbi:metallophosphoesterase [Paenibacillus nanensis]|uniref:Metallophosphoesterase n=1 Tax=Paenibacillus nanensis TaxID=393251 RepID=A0A3A1V1P3_9BACL|nr:metallophosphoesterase family protein [Paenibacillus nanensis]RIX51520.1 metallophosphoesterase [Paenibacillus nanensis]
MDRMDSFAVISDIHSNVYALEAVLQDIESRGIPHIVNLGDTLFGPIAPVETAELLMGKPNVTNIRGNCDRYLLQSEPASPTFQYVKPLLTQEINGWLRSFRTTWAYEELLFCHGTPFSDETYLLEEVTPDGAREKDVEALMRELADIPQSVIFCGHTHLQKLVTLPDDRRIVNAGSVGLPAYEEDAPYPHVMESGSPHARYATVSRRSGSWRVEPVLLAYDYEQAARAAERNGRMDYSHAIRTGRARI